MMTGKMKMLTNQRAHVYNVKIPEIFVVMTDTCTWDKSYPCELILTNISEVLKWQMVETKLYYCLRGQKSAH